MEWRNVKKGRKTWSCNFCFESNRGGYQTNVEQWFWTTIGIHWEWVTTTAGNVISIFLPSHWMSNLSFLSRVDVTKLKNVVCICSVNLVSSISIPDIDEDIKPRWPKTRLPKKEMNGCFILLYLGERMCINLLCKVMKTSERQKLDKAFFHDLFLQKIPRYGADSHSWP